MKNILKRQDVFRCNHESHESFGSVVSVYHVMLEKGCHPEGCITFEYHCRLEKSSRKCPRRYKFVGRNCFDCKHYFEHKIHNSPRVLLSDSEYSAFGIEFERFLSFVESIQGRKMSIYGEVVAVKPHFLKTVTLRKERLKVIGFILFLDKPFLAGKTFEDIMYLHISAGQQKSLNFRQGDLVEFQAIPMLDRGRLVGDNVRVLHFDRRGDGEIWTPADALVARAVAQPFEHQQEKCLQCPEGVLVDLESTDGYHVTKGRQIHCLKGFSHPSVCLQGIYTCPDRARSIIRK
ncbi:MAG: hypothetical protein CVV64_04380 [Candidatus Wallbacteria bacterium HGW-Wallbacteria-1]|jgi:hypothetical protein|uniref:Uncharacterized protein n=1 Tax=Candidatus Wallbacteria bacterium HGW-Wallbacteria-1 TaxID=2013854 RepID=A0A2N1PRQ4_9BACT|nr:MAG: hypothetical protein CVV64_04380 [Candidatus Wallbacteria bacterium HGW-Wallbacteria-1]